MDIFAIEIRNVPQIYVLYLYLLCHLLSDIIIPWIATKRVSLDFPPDRTQHLKATNELQNASHVVYFFIDGGANLSFNEFSP